MFELATQYREEAGLGRQKGKRTSRLPTNIYQTRRYWCKFAFELAITPEFNVDVFASFNMSFLHLSRNRNRLTVKVVVERNTSQFEERGNDVRMCCRIRLGHAFLNVWSSYEERDVDVFFRIANFTWW